MSLHRDFGSWLKAVDTALFRLSRRRLNRGTFQRITKLHAAIERFIEDHDAEPKP